MTLLGFINLYGFCVLTSSAKLKETRYYAFIGDGDGNYNKEECDAFISYFNFKGVDANIKFCFPAHTKNWSYVG